MKNRRVRSGMDMRAAERLAVKLGARIEPVPGTGERKMVFPNREEVRYSVRRKDASRAVTTMIRHHFGL